MRENQQREFNRGEIVIWVRPGYPSDTLTRAEFLHFTKEKLAVRVETPTGATICKLVNPNRIRKLSR